MRDPYEILGVPRGSGMDRVNAAYRELARKYQDSDPKKMDEINAAYDAIAMDSPGTGGYSSAGSSYSYAGTADYPISEPRSTPTGSRTLRCSSTAYLRACATRSGITSRAPFSRKGAGEEAADNFGRACDMDPTNNTYKMAFNKVNQARSGGYRAERRKDSDSGCSACDICSGLMCADCCCECFGGDLIPCC